MKIWDFSSFENHFALFSASVAFDVAMAQESLQMELLEMQIPGFFSHDPVSLKTSESLPQGLRQCLVLPMCVWTVIFLHDQEF
jgi:hypothetical protein